MSAEELKRQALELLAARPYGPDLEEEPAEDELADWVTPINWAEFWATETPTQEWVIEGVVPAGRQVAVYSPPKQGKSLFALDACAAAATGRPVLGQPARAPVRVIYIDQEMTRDDLSERLVDLGYGPESDLSNLAYYQLVDLPALDTELGGQVVESIARRFGADVVVLDTMARVVAGDENQADTYRNFYRYTGRRLKAMNVALLRLDHGGKDPEKGQRGSSEKAGDVDVVFRLTAADGTVVLRRTHSRIPWVPAEITMTRAEEPRLAHIITPDAVPPVVATIIGELDRLTVPVDTSGNAAHRALREAGIGRRKADVLTAVKIRRARA